MKRFLRFRFSHFSSLLLVIFVASGLLMSSIAHAEPKAWVGGIFGLSIPNADSTTSRALMGVTGGAKVGSEFGVGGYFLSSKKDESVAGGASAFDYELYGVEIGYHFEGEAEGVFLAGRVGTSKLKSGDATSSVSVSPAHFGAVAGVNRFISENFSIGGEASFFSVEGASGLAASGATATTKSFTMLNFAATAKLWF
jgi:hypothetical protein